RGRVQDLRRVVQGARASCGGAASGQGRGEYSHSVSSVAEGDCTADEANPKLPSEVWVLITANVVIALGYGVVSPVLPQYARDFGVSISAATFVITAFSLMRLVSGPAGGLFAGESGEWPAD